MVGRVGEGMGGGEGRIGERRVGGGGQERIGESRGGRVGDGRVGVRGKGRVGCEDQISPIVYPE